MDVVPPPRLIKPVRWTPPDPLALWPPLLEGAPTLTLLALGACLLARGRRGLTLIREIRAKLFD